MIGTVVAIVAALGVQTPVPPAPVDPPPIINAPCPDHLSSACLLGDTIYIDRSEFASWGRDAAYGYRLAKLHEYGHVMDRLRLTDDERAEYSALIRRSDMPWADPDPNDLGEAWRFPQERFADDYARCRMPGSKWPGLAVRRVCPFVVRVLLDP